MSTPPEPADTGPLRIGLLRLSDAAPVVMARAAGLFAAQGLEVVVSIASSWSALADQLAYGLVDAAVMTPPLVLAQSLGLRQPAVPLLVPLNLSSGGNALTLSRPLAAALRQATPGRQMTPGHAGAGHAGADHTDSLLEPLALGLALRRVLDRLLQDGGAPRPVLAVVHAHSTHNLLLRYWLAGCGIDPDRDVSLAVVPPVDMTQALAIGRIDGFMAGAPWGAVATREGKGETVLPGSRIWRHHPEKCLAVRAAWAERAPERLQALLRALLLACRRCQDPAHVGETAALLASPELIGVNAELIVEALKTTGPPPASGGDRLDFRRTRPSRAAAALLMRQMGRWRDMPAENVLGTCIHRTYRPDLHDGAVTSLAWSAQERLAAADPPITAEDFFDHARSQA